MWMNHFAKPTPIRDMRLSSVSASLHTAFIALVFLDAGVSVSLNLDGRESQ